MALLDVRNLEKWYGRRQVVKSVSFTVDPGQIVGLLGPNGAGKTTSFRMTIGLVEPDGGKVLFNGRDVTRLPMYRRARAGLGYLPQELSIFRQLSVEKNLMAILETRSGLSGRERRARRDQLLKMFGLEEIRKVQAMRISGGQKRRLEIARCLITEPSVIMLDEPFAGIDPITISEIQGVIADLAQQQEIGILLCDHNFRATLEITDTNLVIDKGTVLVTGSRADVLNHPEVRRVYLGDRFDAGHLLEDLSQPHQSRVQEPPALTTSLAGNSEISTQGAQADDDTTPVHPPTPSVSEQDSRSQESELSVIPTHRMDQTAHRSHGVGDAQIDLDRSLLPDDPVNDYAQALLNESPASRIDPGHTLGAIYHNQREFYIAPDMVPVDLGQDDRQNQRQNSERSHNADQ